MRIDLHCPVCLKDHRADFQAQGAEFLCEQCGQKLRVPVVSPLCPVCGVRMEKPGRDWDVGLLVALLAIPFGLAANYYARTLVLAISGTSVFPWDLRAALWAIGPCLAACLLSAAAAVQRFRTPVVECSGCHAVVRSMSLTLWTQKPAEGLCPCCSAPLVKAAAVDRIGGLVFLVLAILFIVPLAVVLAPMVAEGERDFAILIPAVLIAGLLGLAALSVAIRLLRRKVLACPRCRCRLLA